MFFYDLLITTMDDTEQHHEKTCFLHMQNKDADQLSGNCAADQCLYFRYNIYCTIPLLPTFKISSLLPSSVAVQISLCQTWSETPTKLTIKRE